MNSHIRNLAIIAHVDHGKTTLMDAILHQTQIFRENQAVQERVMDSMDLEREKGITIRAKNASVTYQDYTINLIDTPGHADFGGEVERVLKMADGALLLVDSKEGPMPQTKFVLKKALALGLRVVVVINKIDRPDANPDMVVDKTFDLFVTLNANDKQLDFPIVYASAINGSASLETDQTGKDLTELFEVIVNEIPAPTSPMTEAFRMLTLNLQFDKFKGTMAVGRIDAGKIIKGMSVVRIDKTGNQTKNTITSLLKYNGMELVEATEIVAGDIAVIAGIANIEIGDTIADSQNPVQIPPVEVESPTLQMMFAINDSPFSGKEGKYSTSRMIRDRLYKEQETNISLRIEDTDSPDKFLVAGRGELHLAVLIETMRREGYEFSVGRPQVILQEQDGAVKEPYEVLSLDVPEEYSGKIIEAVNKRQGELSNMEINEHNESHIEYKITTQNLIGLRSILLTLSKGTVIMNSSFLEYGPRISSGKGRSTGSIVSLELGKITKYALDGASDRGIFFVSDGTEVYPGMVLGESNREQDVEINPVKAKKLTNMRASGSDDGVFIAPPKDMSLEASIEYLADDELLEVTPQSLRIRKRILDSNERKRSNRD
ncbi:translational GTPase TypA [bacterium]|nr:translational GTPase TypA [Candidatus Elulimicrobium humile]